jgi:hypothetical protein
MALLPSKSLNPCCGYITNAADEVITGWDPLTEPRPGDIAICLNCGALLTFLNAEGDKRLAWPGEVARLNSRERRMLRKSQQYISKRGRLRKLS